jgi:hypothetical protein
MLTNIIPFPKEAQQKLSGTAQKVFLDNQKIENDLKANASLLFLL